MKNMYKNFISGFSLAEALISMALLGLILMMMTPIFVARTSDTSSVYCITGGTKTFTKDGIFEVEKGMSKLYLSAIKSGTDGYANNAGEGYLLWSKHNGINVSRGNIKQIRVKFENGEPKIFTVDPEGREKEVKTEFKSNSADIKHVENHYLFRSGIPNFGGFPGPLYGAGTAGNVNTNSQLGGIVIIDWATDCILSE